MNVTDFGYNLVVDLDTRSTSSQLFLLVKASPILRHSLEDEHNYASYYQFKKQGDHHGVVVTSEHLSPGRWYIGVCNYVQEVALFNDRAPPKSGSQQNLPSPDDAGYTIVATLNRTKDTPHTPQSHSRHNAGDKREQHSNKIPLDEFEMEKRGFVNLHDDDDDVRPSRSANGGSFGKNNEPNQGGQCLSLSHTHTQRCTHAMALSRALSLSSDMPYL